jgi:hypothetical protein
MEHYGWICPRCGQIYAPWVESCDCKPEKLGQIGFSYPIEISYPMANDKTSAKPVTKRAVNTCCSSAANSHTASKSTNSIISDFLDRKMK